MQIVGRRVSFDPAEGRSLVRRLTAARADRSLIRAAWPRPSQNRFLPLCAARSCALQRSGRPGPAFMAAAWPVDASFNANPADFGRTASRGARADVFRSVSDRLDHTA
jgi:hypothetical protein